ncbi:MAG: tetratricopeptide repeat protein [Gammaproteobacteria bacterium]|nr:tetratricopeptide repeat protein [Pseudomonadales bacterium]
MLRQQADELFRQGLQFHREGALQQAAQCYADVLALQPDHYLALNNAGLLAWDLGRSERALVLLNAARALAPEDPEVLKNLARVQLKLGDTESAEKTFQDALSHSRGDSRLLLELADVLYDRGRIDEAKDLLEAQLEKTPAPVQTLFRLGVICMRKGDHANAENRLRQALALEPTNSQILNQLADQYLLSRKTDQAGECLNLSLQHDPGNTRALALLAVLFNLAGDEQQLFQLYRPDRLLRETFVSVPNGYASLKEFNATLLAGITQHAEMRTESDDRATTNGLQSRSISALPFAAMTRLNAIISEAVAHMQERCLSDDLASLPFSQALPESYRIESWLVRLRDGGYQKPHVHPSGWLSGCYYLEVPDAVGRAGSDAGFLEFGRPEDIYQVEAPAIFHAYRPSPGGLVTFPSYYWHNTIPFRSTQERICIAFDIRPA